VYRNGSKVQLINKFVKYIKSYNVMKKLEM
jgi:hypothetical protein